jgi:hypothetical protein
VPIEHKRWVLWAILACTLVACDDPVERCPDPAPWQELLANHRARYQAMDIPDALKLLQQATTGSEHAVTDPASASAWTAREWKAMGSGPTEPIVDTLGANGQYARVHLRPYRDAGGRPEPLTTAFVATANHSAPDTALLACAIAAVTPSIPWDSVRWRTEAERWQRSGYPAMHHSAAYEAAHRPAYRVIRLQDVPGLILTAP